MKRHKIDISKLRSNDFYEKRIRKYTTLIKSKPDIKYSIILDNYLGLLRLSILNEEPYDTIKYRATNYITHSILDIKRYDQNIILDYDGSEYSLNKYKSPTTDISRRIFGLLNIAICFQDDNLVEEVSNLKDSIEGNPYWVTSTKYLKNILNPISDKISLVEHQNLIDSYTQKGTTIYHSLNGQQIIESKALKEIYQTLRTPILKLYQLAFDNESSAFNRKLEEYSVSKREYIGRFKKLHMHEHWIDFNAMGACKFAQSNGIELHYKSEYIPMDIITKVDNM